MVGLALVAALAVAAPSAAAKPPLRDACKLISKSKVEQITDKPVRGFHRIGKSPAGRYTFGCFWRTGKERTEGSDIVVLQEKSGKAAKDEYNYRRKGPFSPPAKNVRRIGDEAFVFGGLITVRSGRYVLEAGSNDLGVIGGGGNDARANAYATKLVKPAVRKLRKNYR